MKLPGFATPVLTCSSEWSLHQEVSLSQSLATGTASEAGELETGELCRRSALEWTLPLHAKPGPPRHESSE